MPKMYFTRNELWDAVDVEKEENNPYRLKGPVQILPGRPVCLERTQMLARKHVQYVDQ